MINITIAKVKNGISINIDKSIDLNEEKMSSRVSPMVAKPFVASLNPDSKGVEVIVFSDNNIDKTYKGIIELCKQEGLEFQFSTIITPKITYCKEQYFINSPLNDTDMQDLLKRLQSYA